MMIDGQQQNEDWSSSLFACCDSCTCCCACILPCIVLGQNVHQMQQLGITPIPIVDDCECQYGNKACVAGLLYGADTALSFLGSVLSMYNPYWGNLAWLECGSTCLHASIRGTIYRHLVANHQYESQEQDQTNNNCCLFFCCALCCYSCALAQEQRQLQHSLFSPADNNNIKYHNTPFIFDPDNDNNDITQPIIRSTMIN